LYKYVHIVFHYTQHCSMFLFTLFWCSSMLYCT